MVRLPRPCSEPAPTPVPTPCIHGLQALTGPIASMSSPVACSIPSYDITLRGCPYHECGILYGDAGEVTANDRHIAARRPAQGSEGGRLPAVGQAAARVLPCTGTGESETAHLHALTRQMCWQGRMGKGEGPEPVKAPEGVRNVPMPVRVPSPDSSLP